MSDSSGYDIDENYLYHYTSKTKVEEIWKSDRLYPSTDENEGYGYGQGVYFTQLTPKNKKRLCIQLFYNKQLFFKISDLIWTHRRHINE